MNKAYFQHDMAYGKTRDLVKRTQSDKNLKDKTFKTASDPKYDGYQRGLTSMVCKFFDKKSALLNKFGGSGITIEPNYQLENELHKPIIRKLKKKVYSSFTDDIQGVHLADMQSLSKCNQENKYILCAIDLFSKYVWVVPLKDKKEISIVYTFKRIISRGRKTNKIWVDQDSEFYNNSFKAFLK